MSHGVKLSKNQSRKIDEAIKRISNIPYASGVGSIHYSIQCTRPDAVDTLSITSHYRACASDQHWIAVKTISKYLRRTKDLFFVYENEELILERYNDASIQSGVDDVKCQFGCVFKLNEE
ncbi:UNVERIFIED_CONTAM: hypothetical protein Slati_4503600 [Sesamum latifolium]|uniref:Uncharacterized protein n=1 Tax=Sesamum latifolium TaxID=2727402 RepID=A0AAW2STG7_9LAMI